MGRSRGLCVGVALAVTLFVAAACSDGEAADYDAAFQEDFLGQCTDAYGGPGAPRVCGCWYEALSRTVAFKDLPAVDDLLADDFDIAPTRLPGGELDLALELLATCVRSLGAEPTLGDPVPLPTTPRPPAPPTTTTVVA
jgi:hypothetical protein